MQELPNKQPQSRTKLLKHIRKFYKSFRIWLQQTDFLIAFRGGQYVLLYPKNLCEECESELSKCIILGLQKQWTPIMIKLEIDEGECCEYVNSTVKHIQRELHLKPPQCVSKNQSSSHDVSSLNRLKPLHQNS